MRLLVGLVEGFFRRLKVFGARHEQRATRPAFRRRWADRVARIPRVGGGPPPLDGRRLAARDRAAVATVEDQRQLDVLVQQAIEQAGQLHVADVELSGVRIGRDDRLVQPVELDRGERVHTLRTMAGVIEDHHVAGLRVGDQSLDGRENPVARRLLVAQQPHVGESVLGVLEHRGHGLRVIHRTVERRDPRARVVRAVARGQCAAHLRAPRRHRSRHAGPPRIELRVRISICVDPDHQRSPRLRASGSGECQRHRRDHRQVPRSAHPRSHYRRSPIPMAVARAVHRVPVCKLTSLPVRRTSTSERTSPR